MRKLYSVFTAVLMFFALLQDPVDAQVLNLSQVIQEQSQWCWAATSSCGLDYFGYPVEQCTIAEYTRTVASWHNFGPVNCCTDPNQGCNYWNYMFGSTGSLEDILIHFGNLHVNNLSTTLSLSEIQTEVNAARPFIFRWGWYSGGGHFLVGYGISGSNIYYMNPLPGYGFEIATYTWLLDDGNHSWTHTQTFCVPPQPGVISGAANVCQGSVSTYEVSPVTGATSYTWTLPPGWTGSSNTRTINATAGSTGGTISVVGNNSCGISYPQAKDVTVSPVDVSVTVSGPTLTANATPATYQWLTCPSMTVIAGETHQSYTATHTGNYAVLVTQNGCTATSACYPAVVSGVSNLSGPHGVTAYPNPFSGLLTLKFSGLPDDTYTIILSSTLGENLYKKEFVLSNPDSETRLDLTGLSKGIYFITVRSGKLNEVFKVEKRD
jgi:hypothetical protein